MKNSFIIQCGMGLLCGIMAACGTADRKAGEDPDKPNIVYILADDMGIGDISVYNPDGKIQTPELDRLAAEGIRFLDAHSPSSVCTPTRYSILTGDYPWRSRLPQGVLRGYGRALIPSGHYTVGHMLQEQGYHTAVIGKWHLGLDWRLSDTTQSTRAAAFTSVNEQGQVKDMDPRFIDFATPPGNGPRTKGFDYSFILPASLDMEPYCYLKNDTLTEIPTAYTPGNDLHTGYTGAFWRAGKMAPSFRFDKVLDTFVHQARTYLEERSTARQPFFLYLPLPAPHTPWMPSPEYHNSSGAGDYGDFVRMVDAAVGKVLRALDSLSLTGNTLVIFASDNGPYWRPAHIEKTGHRAAGIYRGMKADAWEGGHRVPLIVRWPGKVAPGAVTAATTTLANLTATTAEILGVPLPDTAAIDSYSVLSVLLEKSDTVPRQEAVVHHSSLDFYAIRQGSWKLILGAGSGGFSEPQQYDPKPGEPEGQLFNLSEDPGETINLYADNPEKVKTLSELLINIKGQKKRRP